MKRRLVALLMLMLYLAGCHTWRPATISPRQLIEEEQPSTVRVTLTDGTEVTLRGPLIRNDSIGGVALSDISTVEVRRISIAKTLGVIGAFYVGLILICAPEDSCR